MTRTQRLYSYFALCIAAVSLIAGCAGNRPSGFEFMLEQKKNADSDTTVKKIYLSSTKPIDSVDVNKLIFDIFRIEIDEYPEKIKLYTRVFDSLGAFVTNMADPYRKDSSITYFPRMRETLGKVYNLRNVEIDSFKVREFGAGDSIPYNIVLNVDYSGSMGPVMDAIFQGTELFVSMKLDYDKIGIASFNHKLDIKVPMSSSKSDILTMYRAKRQTGYGRFSGVYEAVWNSLAIFNDTPSEVPRVLVMFTDGDDNYSKKELGDLIEKAKAMNVHVFCVAFGYSKDDKLSQLASFTGGKFYKFYTKEELIAIFRDIYMSLRYYYLVTYTPPKYWGYHKVYAYLNAPGRADSLIAEGEYDTSDLWKDVGDEFVRPILFDFNKSELKAESSVIIDEIVDAMLSRPRLKLEVQGHTDNVGGDEYNQKLSEARAASVYDALARRGIDPSRLRYIGFGMSKPIASNDTEEGRAKNRRTQFVVLAK